MRPPYLRRLPPMARLDSRLLVLFLLACGQPDALWDRIRNYFGCEENKNSR